MSSDANFGCDGTQHSLSDVPKECYDLLRHPRRLRLLNLLGAATRPLSVSELEAALAEEEETDRRSVRISLVHTHLPTLADHDVIEWDGDDVTLVDDAAVPPSDLVALLESDAASDRLLETIVHPERMATLSILEGMAVCTFETLATELAAHDGASVSDADEAAIVLHHSHLPALDDVGILEYDGDGLIVMADRGMPLLG